MPPKRVASQAGPSRTNTSSEAPTPKFLERVALKYAQPPATFHHGLSSDFVNNKPVVWFNPDTTKRRRESYLDYQPAPLNPTAAELYRQNEEQPQLALGLFIGFLVTKNLKKPSSRIPWKNRLSISENVKEGNERALPFTTDPDGVYRVVYRIDKNKSYDEYQGAYYILIRANPDQQNVFTGFRGCKTGTEDSIFFLHPYRFDDQCMSVPFKRHQSEAHIREVVQEFLGIRNTTGSSLQLVPATDPLGALANYFVTKDEGQLRTAMAMLKTTKAEDDKKSFLCQLANEAPGAPLSEGDLVIAWQQFTAADEECPDVFKDVSTKVVRMFVEGVRLVGPGTKFRHLRIAAADFMRSWKRYTDMGLEPTADTCERRAQNALEFAKEAGGPSE